MNASNMSASGIYWRTMGIEAISGAFRSIFFMFLISPIWFFIGAFLMLFGMDFDAFIGFFFTMSFLSGLALGYLTFVFSWISYSGGGGGYKFTKFALGARELSTREREKIHQNLKVIQENLGSASVISFSEMFAVDSPIETAYTIGTTLYLSSGAIDSQYLNVFLAHELGHLNDGDGGVVLALRRLVFPLFYLFMGSVRDFSTGRSNPGSRQQTQSQSDIYYSMINGIIFLILATIGGGLGVWLNSWAWAGYFRERDYLADQFVVQAGLKEVLIEWLELKKFYDTSVPYMLGWQPANELRIDRVLHQQSA